MAGKEEKVFSLSEVSWRMLGTLCSKELHYVTVFLHAQSVQQLTSQLEELKEQKCHFDNRLGEETRSVSCRPQEDEGGEVLRLNGLLEKTEKELFETRTQLEAKVSILHCRPNLTSYVPIMCSSMDPHPVHCCGAVGIFIHVYYPVSLQSLLHTKCTASDGSSLGMRLFCTTQFYILPHFCSDWGRKRSTVLYSGVKFTFHRL